MHIYVGRNPKIKMLFFLLVIETGKDGSYAMKTVLMKLMLLICGSVCLLYIWICLEVKWVICVGWALFGGYMSTVEEDCESYCTKMPPIRTLRNTTNKNLGWGLGIKLFPSIFFI